MDFLAGLVLSLLTADEVFFHELYTTLSLGSDGVALPAGDTFCFLDEV